MFYAFITLLLLAGAYLLKLQRDVTIIVVGAWTIGWLGMRLAETYFDHLRKKTEEKLAGEEQDDEALTDVAPSPEAGLPASSLAPSTTSSYSRYFEITSKLHKIYNEDLLFETFCSSLKKLLNPRFCFLCLPTTDSPGLKLTFKLGSDDTGLDGHEIGGDSAVFDLFRRKPDTYSVGELIELAGDDRDLKRLHDGGTELVVPISVSEKQVGLLGLSGRRMDGDGYTIGDKEMLLALCQTVEIVLENIQQFKKIEELSYTDSMTRLYNYRYFYKRLNEEILRAKRFSRYLALAIFDLDDFKVFNDSYGHQTGDYLLRQLGALLLESVRSIDIVCRYGGEEFCVIMPESDNGSCEQFMERLRVKVAEHKFRNRFRDAQHSVTVSAGAGVFPTDARRSDRLIYCADMALLAAKKAGKNVCRMYRGLDKGQNSRAERSSAENREE